MVSSAQLLERLAGGVSFLGLKMSACTVRKGNKMQAYMAAGHWYFNRGRSVLVSEDGPGGDDWVLSDVAWSFKVSCLFLFCLFAACDEPGITRNN